MIRGRKTKYKPKFCQFAIDFLAKGYSKMALAGELGISRDTLYEWCKAKPEFSDSIKVGEAKSQYYWEKIGLEAMNGKVKGFKSAIWIFTMKSRFGWSDYGADKYQNIDENILINEKEAEAPEKKLSEILAKYSYKTINIPRTN